MSWALWEERRSGGAMRWDEMKVLREIFCWLESPVAPLNVPLHIRQWDENARRWRQRRRLGGDVWSRPTMIPTRVLLMCLFVDITILRFFSSFFPFPSFVVVVVRSDDSDDSAERAARKRSKLSSTHFPIIKFSIFHTPFWLASPSPAEDFHSLHTHDVSNV